MSGVVWALDEFLFLFLFTLILTNYLLFVQPEVIYEISDKDGGDDEMGLNGDVMHLLLVVLDLYFAY